MKIANDPFRFFARFVLRFATGRSARNVRELRDALRDLPLDVLYQHTHSFLAGHESLVPELSNDFAPWVTEALHDPALGERLGCVDVLGISTLSDLRAEFLGILEEALRQGPGRDAPEGGEFQLMSAVRFSIPLGIEARTLAELITAIEQVGPSSLYLHLYEAKLRGGGGVSDFSRWLEKEMEAPSLARAVGELDLYGWTLTDIRRRLLDVLGAANTGEEHASA